MPPPILLPVGNGYLVAKNQAVYKANPSPIANTVSRLPLTLSPNVRLMNLQPTDIQHIIEIVRRSGNLVRRMQRKGLHEIVSKSSAIDITTEADLASEALLREQLAASFPHVGFWGEESNEPPQSESFWIADPIDGTTNFANGHPWFAVNLALQHGKETLLAVTLDAANERLFWARPGEGAFQRVAQAGGDETDQPLHVNEIDALPRALLATGFPYHRATAVDHGGREFLRLMERSVGVRVLGAAALDLASVATGALAGFWEGWLQPWDAAAGALLVREAGGRATNYHGQPWTIADGHIVATNGRLHEMLLAELHAAREGLSESRLSQRP